MPLTKSELDTASIAVLESWYDDPDLFDREVWPDDPPEPWQSKASGLVVMQDRVAIRSGHGVGKTAWLARRIIWWGTTRNPWKVGVTAPSSSQMYDALWSELAKWHAKMPDGLRELFVWSTERFEWKEEPAVSFAVAKTARRETPDALAGLHSETCSTSSTKRRAWTTSFSRPHGARCPRWVLKPS